MNVNLKTASSSSDDSGDIAFYYGNGQEKARIWTANTYTGTANSGIGPNYRAYKDDGTQIASGRLLCSFGDHMTGDLYFDSASVGICYKGTKSGGRMISFIDNPSDTSGNGIAIGAGGTTIIGGGESASAMVGSLSGGGGELMYIGNDGDVHIHTNLQNGWSSRKTFTFSAGGRLTIPEYCYAAYFHQSSGVEVPSASSYAIYCNSDGFFRKSNMSNMRIALGAMRNLSYAKKEVTLSSGKAMIDLGSTYGSTHFVVCASGYFKADASTVIDVGIQDGRYIRCHQNTASGSNNVAVICYWYY
jgi:hypothetical protein